MQNASRRLYVDPLNITDYGRSDFELEAFAIMCVCVAGKNAVQQAKKLEALLLQCPHDKLPLEWLTLGSVVRTKEWLEFVKMGQYTRIAKAIHDLAKLDLRTCTIDELAECHGIKYKTASFFVLHSRPNAKAVVLDTHVLKWLGHFVWPDEVPSSVPGSKKVYTKWAERASDLFCKLFGDQADFAKIDLGIWKRMRSVG